MDREDGDRGSRKTSILLEESVLLRLCMDHSIVLPSFLLFGFFFLLKLKKKSQILLLALL